MNYLRQFTMEETSPYHERMTPDREGEHQRKPSRRLIFLHKTADSDFATIYKQGKTSIVTMEMKKYNISLLALIGIAETR